MMKKGKQKQVSVMLSDGWWMRLASICNSKADANKSHSDAIVDVTGISRRTLAKAKTTNQFTQDTFSRLASALAITPDALLQVLAPPDNTQLINPGEKPESSARQKVKHAQEMARAGKTTEAIEGMTEALALANSEQNEEEVVEILLALAILSGGRQRPGDRKHYFKEAMQRFENIKSPATKVIFFRAQAADCTDARDMIGAETAYRSALAICLNEKDDKKGNLALQGCIVRSSFVHFLCNLNRIEEARPLLEECEEYARGNPNAEESELLQAALEAGIHFSVSTCDEKGAITRISEMEQAAATMRLANRIGGDLINVANHLSHRKMHRAALDAARAAIRLGHRCDNTKSPNFLVGAFYTEAVVLLQAGEDQKALEKAQALLGLCNSPEDRVIKQAAQQLIAEVRRVSGDSQSAVDLAQQVLDSASGRPEEIAFLKSALARALNDNGQTEQALKEAREALILLEHIEISPLAEIDLLSQISNYGSQLGEAVHVSNALERLATIPEQNDKTKEVIANVVARAEANSRIRERILEFSSPIGANLTSHLSSRSLQEANAKVMQPLLQFWESAPDCIGVAYDFWGRGNFARLMQNARNYPNSFNVTVEVRSLDDIKRALRLWGLYADFLLLLWKGRSQNGLAIIPIPEMYDEPGGWGYICASDIITKEGSSKTWHPAMAHISTIPDDVAAFLATEARPFVEAGRLVVVPAPAAGCINAGHGPFEQLLAEAMNAVPNVRWRGVPGVSIGLLPFSPDVPLHLLVDLANNQADRLRKLRLLLIQRTRRIQSEEGLSADARTLSMEIDDALRDLSDKTDTYARKKGVGKGKEQLRGTTARFRSNGNALSGKSGAATFAPLFIMQTLGYGWRVESTTIAVPPKRFEPESGDVVGTWLSPPSRGWRWAVIRTG